VWGGLLTGRNSVGERLIKKLEKQVGKCPHKFAVFKTSKVLAAVNS